MHGAQGARSLRWDFGAETLNACTSGCCLIIMPVCVFHHLLSSSGPWSQLLLPLIKVRAFLKKHSLVWKMCSLCVRFGVICVRLRHLFLEYQLRRFPKYGAGIALCRLLRIPCSTCTFIYMTPAVFPFNLWLLRKDKLCVSSVFSRLFLIESVGFWFARGEL